MKYEYESMKVGNYIFKSFLNCLSGSFSCQRQLIWASVFGHWAFFSRPSPKAGRELQTEFEIREEGGSEK